MFRSLFRPKVMPLSLQPVGGEFYAQVFENPRTGVSRNLFWTFSVELEPITLDGEEWDCSFSAEWLSWPVATWRDLETMSLSNVKLPSMVEASLYLMAEHHPARLSELRLSERDGVSFELTLAASAQVGTEKGERVVPVSFTTRLQFAGIIVVSDNLQPKPSSADAAAAAVSEFIQLDGLQNPRSEEWRYVLDPLA